MAPQPNALRPVKPPLVAARVPHRPSKEAIPSPRIFMAKVKPALSRKPRCAHHWAAAIPPLSRSLQLAKLFSIWDRAEAWTFCSPRAVWAPPERETDETLKAQMEPLQQQRLLVQRQNARPRPVLSALDVAERIADVVTIVNRALDNGLEQPALATNCALRDDAAILVPRIAGHLLQDRDGAVLVIEAIHQLFPWLRHLFADSVYNGPNLHAALTKFGNWTIEIVKRAADAAGFQLLPRRWVVERSLAWLNRNRRLAKDFEASIASARAWVYIASVQLLIRRLA